MTETKFAPIGTAIRCNTCGEPIGWLTKDVEYGAILYADRLRLASGETPEFGMALACPCGARTGFHVQVGDEFWRCG